MILRDPRGVTLTELMIVMVLAALVMVGLVTFYLNSQAMWLDASSQALTQRDATLLLDKITIETRQSARAEIADDPDAEHQTLTLYDSGGIERCQFRWGDPIKSPSDSLVHFVVPGSVGGPSNIDKGPVTTSRVVRFEFETDHNSFVTLRLLQMRSATGQPVELTSTIAIYNH